MCDYSLVKMRPGANRRLKIDTFEQRYKLSPIDLKENYPGLLRQIRQSGSTIFNPMMYYNNTHAPPNELRIEGLAWDFILSRCGILEDQSRFGDVPPIVGRDEHNVLYDGFKDLQSLLPYELAGLDTRDFYPLFDDCMDVLDRLCTRLGLGGYRKGLYVEVVEMGRIFAPFVTEISFELSDQSIIWSFLESFYNLTASMGPPAVDQTLTEVLFTIGPFYNNWVKDAAMLFQGQNIYLAQLILMILP